MPTCARTHHHLTRESTLMTEMPNHVHLHTHIHIKAHSAMLCNTTCTPKRVLTHANTHTHSTTTCTSAGISPTLPACCCAGRRRPSSAAGRSTARWPASVESPTWRAALTRSWLSTSGSCCRCVEWGAEEGMKSGWGGGLAVTHGPSERSACAHQDLPPRLSVLLVERAHQGHDAHQAMMHIRAMMHIGAMMHIRAMHITAMCA